jgi:ubiquinone/menaquinone biosynthesis C-methylase UbiE
MAFKPRVHTVHNPKWKTPVRTVENRWDLLYSDYPDVYREFASVTGKPAKQVHELFDFEAKLVVDAGSGTGKSSFRVAPVAKMVYGIEIEDSMISVAKRELRKRHLTNVCFLRGDARSMPLKDDSVDIVMGITLAIYPPEGFRDFVREATRVVRDGGLIVTQDVAPGWYGGELCRVIRNENELRFIDRLLVKEFGFGHKDVYSTSDYGSVGRMLRTYGFIFGKNAIDYIIEHGKTSIKWKNRYHYKVVKKHPERRMSSRSDSDLTSNYSDPPIDPTRTRS